MMNELKKRHYDIFSIFVDNLLFVVEICIEYLYDVTQIFFSHAMRYTHFCFLFL